MNFSNKKKKMILAEETQTGKNIRFIFNNSIIVLSIIYYLFNIYSIPRLCLIIAALINIYISNKIIKTKQWWNFLILYKTN